MHTFEWIIMLLLAVAALAEVARRIDVPYPTLLALGGAVLAIFPGGPNWTLDPEMVLALFVAPVLLDGAYDTSPSDLKKYWRPIAGLVVAAVGTTVIGVAFACRWLLPDMPWAIAIALGAIVAPPDAAAAMAVMRQVGLPHRVLAILEGESLLNDASALLIYRLALMSIAVESLGADDYLPVLLLTVFGSVVAGIVLGFVLRPLLSASRHVPTSLILQFAFTFGVWITAERLGLSGILTMVAFAITLARGGGPRIPAHMRVPIFAFWESVVFLLNALAFVFIGLQLRPIWERLGNTAARTDALMVAFAVLTVVVATRFLWVMGYVYSSKIKPFQREITQQTSWGVAMVVSWAGMRGIVTLAAAFALPENLADGRPFPYRDLVLLSAFTVVLGTLLLQGLTMKPIIRKLNLAADDSLDREVHTARKLVYQALLDVIKDESSDHAQVLRTEYQAVIDHAESSEQTTSFLELPGRVLRRRALKSARERAIDLRNREVIGERAYRLLIQEIDLAELSAAGSLSG